ncbi:MAG: ABC transporter permease [Silvibacterium sp.]
MKWFRQLFSRDRRYDDLSVSIREHLEEKIEELMEEGMSRADAERAARREFGNVALVEEYSREIWQWPTIESIWADVSFALRQLIKSPVFTLTAVVTLSLGIAVNATMFSMVSAFLMPRLPGRDPGSMVVISGVNPNRGFLPDANAVSAPNYLAWRGDNKVFAEMAAADEFRTASLAGRGQPEAIQYAAVSPNYFNVFGTSSQLGRTFAAGEDQPGRDHVAILSHGLWERRFGSDPSVVGRTVRLNREDYVVVGVMPAEFSLLGFTPQLWTPLTLTAADQTAGARKDRSLYLFARLVPGVTLEQARAEMATLARQAEKDFPETEKRWGATAKTLPDFLVYSFGIRTALAVIMTTVSFILLIACANVAGLLLTRAAGRQKEMAVRASLGASRVRIVRQLLTEGLVIAFLGCGAGLLLTYAGIRLLRAGLTFNDAISAVPLRLDANVLTFAVCVSLVCALLSSLAPALRTSRIEINADLRSEGRAATAGRSHSRLRAVLVGGEFAIALFLLIGCSLLVRGIYLLERQKLGFRPDHILTAGVELDQARYSDSSQQIAFVRSLVSRLQQIPGVEDAAVASSLPSSGFGTVPIRIKGEPELPASQQRFASNVVVTTDYLQAAGVPLVRGRAFTEGDDDNAPRVVLVNKEFARRYFQDRNPLGKQIRVDTRDSAPAWSEIVGVVSDVKSYSEEPRVDPEVYQAFLQQPVASFSIMLRSNVEPDSLTPALRQAVARLDVELPLLRVMSMEGIIDTQKNGNPLFTRMLGIFSSLALVLAAIGIYGLVAYSVGQRSHEIGIRLALGAKGSDISWMILKEGLKIAAIGSAIGLVMALPLPKLFGSIFTGLSVSAPGLYPIVLAAMLLVAILATFGPARRATRVDPTAALRSE